MAHVTTDSGAYVAGKPDPKMKPPFPGYTPEQAAADAAERNRRAEALGITTRYVVVD